MRIQYLTAFLLGVIATLLAVLVFDRPTQPLHAQSVDGGSGFVVGTANYYENGGRNLVWILNATEKGAPKLAIYEAKEQNLQLKYARNLTYDFMYDYFPGREEAHIPPVAQAMKETAKKREEKPEKPK